jgi:hypothetical protein
MAKRSQRKLRRQAASGPASAPGQGDTARLRLDTALGQPQLQAGISAAIRTWLHGWRLVVVVVAALEVAFTLTGLIASTLGSREPFEGNWQELVYTGPLSQFISFWQRWDALWYQHIAEAGYRANDGSTAFFPLYPVLSRVVSLPLAGNTVLAELIISVASAVGAMWLLRELVARDRWWAPVKQGTTPKSQVTRHPRKLPVPELTVLLTVLFPTGFFLLAPYTESLFLLLTFASFLLARTGRFWAAGCVALLASLARTQGIFLALPIAYEHLRQRGSVPWLRGRAGRPPSFSILAAALPIVGIGAFVLFQTLALGEHHTGVAALAMWGYQIAAPWDAISASLNFIVGTTAGDGQPQIEAFNLLCLLGFTAIAIVGARRLPVSYSLYAWPSLALLLARQMYFSPLMSVARYVPVVFPCLILLGLWLSPRPKLAVAWLALSLVAELVLFQYWVRWGFVA